MSVRPECWHGLHLSALNDDPDELERIHSEASAREKKGGEVEDGGRAMLELRTGGPGRRTPIMVAAGDPPISTCIFFFLFCFVGANTKITFPPRAVFPFVRN